jgi:putative transposase
MVVLPDHIHAVWTLPEGDCDFPVRWRLIKMRFSKSIAPGEPLTASRRVRGERGDLAAALLGARDPRRAGL